jgi:hypothetical protein
MSDATTTSQAPNWRIKGDWWDLCNCAIGCPCVFSAPPTQGNCEGVLTWLIREGHFGDVRLDGLAIVLINYFEGTVFDKNREFGFLADERATPTQRDAVRRIFSGQAGGAFKAWADLTIKFHGVEFVPMTVSFDPERWRVLVPGLVDGIGAPFRKYMVPEGDTCRIYNAPRPEVTPGYITVGHAIKNVVTNAFGRTFNWTGHSAKHISFDMRGPDQFTWQKSLEAQKGT